MAEEKQRTEKRKRSVTWRRGIHLARVSSRNGVVSRMEEKAIWRALATSLEINQLNLCCFESSFISWFYCIVSPNPPDVIRMREILRSGSDMLRLPVILLLDKFLFMILARGVQNEVVN
ncbi:hypothetical protein OIU77_016993 [Salix suchowensis]|uniref:Uncharacterized protein n=1 Tax=Salix suchowensis TaxID=1278906 RepID=A0ABQ8ZMN8_9ROSI|nr:hypothetical protein OIU77_016993 [Salix suchowensis]